MSLADAFAAPVGQTGDASGAIDSSLNKGQNAYLEGGYTSALLHARDALKKNPEDASSLAPMFPSTLSIGRNQRSRNDNS